MQSQLAWSRWPLRQRLFAVIAVLYAALNVAYSAAFPLFESWDERQHYDFVRYLIEERALPVQEPDAPASEYHQPPLYYAISALLTAYLPADPYRPARNPAFAPEYWYRHNKNVYIHPQIIEGWPWQGTSLNAHVIRLLGIGWGIAAMLLVRHLALRFLPDDPGREWLAAGAMALAVFNPTFLYIMSSVNNDVAVTVIGAALALVFVDAATRSLTWRRAALIGVLLGAAALTKWTMAPFAAVALAAIWINREAWQRPARTAAQTGTIIGIAMLVAGWWFWRNERLYGDPTALSAMCRAWGSCYPYAGTIFVPANLWRAFVGYWGTFGPWGSIRLPVWVYVCLLAFAAGGLVGLAWRWIAGGLSGDQKRAVFVLGSMCIGFLVSALYSATQSHHGIHPRFLFGAHAAAAVLLAIGWWHVLNHVRLKGWRAIAWSPVFPLLAVACLVGFIIPTYAPPRTTAKPEDSGYSTPYDVSVGDFARLAGVTVPERASPGSLVWTKVCWETLAETQGDYWQFIHLVGEHDTVVAGIDSIPGRGNYPTVDWQAGRSHCTDWPLEIPRDAPPGQYTVQTGLYERESLERLEATFEDGQRFDPPIIGSIVVDARPGDLPGSAEVAGADFGGLIELRGYEFTIGGSTLTLTLYWEASAPVPQSYTVFVHLTRPGEWESPLAQADGVPRNGLYPTDLWVAGGLVADEHILKVEPGRYEIHVGLYDLASGQRLPGPAPNSAYTIPVEVNVP